MVFEVYFKGLSTLLDEPGETFPRRSDLKILRGKTLTKTPTWHKAIILVQLSKGHQLRLVGWQLNKKGEWRLRQKFNISRGYALNISEVCEAYANEWDD
ncbi:MAG: hypothetical protein ACFFDU_05255 [Candidatus Thorarchaeota archaeon]